MESLVFAALALDAAGREITRDTLQAAAEAVGIHVDEGCLEVLLLLVRSLRKPAAPPPRADVPPSLREEAPPPPPPDEGTGDANPVSSYYVYAIVPGEERESLGPVGIEGREVFTVSGGSLRAVVHACPDELPESAAGAVVESWVLAHGAVVDLAQERFGAVLPVGLGHFLGRRGCDPEEVVAGWLNENQERFFRQIEEVRGKREYGIQVFWDPETVAARLAGESPELRRLEAEMEGKTPGLAYLNRERYESALSQEATRLAEASGQACLALIRKHAADLRLGRRRKTEEAGKEMLLNVSCLMDPVQVGDLGSELEDMAADRGLVVRLTGPWPPYSFVA